MNENLNSVDLGDFSFADNAIALANDLIDSLVIDVAVDLDFAFGLDLNPMFNSPSAPSTSSGPFVSLTPSNGPSVSASPSMSAMPSSGPSMSSGPSVLAASSATSILDRIPDPFIQLNQFDISGLIGVNEWSSSLDFNGLLFSITMAKALLSINATLSTSSEPIVINTPSELAGLVQPASGNDGIVVQASLEVVFPIFLIINNVGLGAKIKFS